MPGAGRMAVDVAARVRAGTSAVGPPQVRRASPSAGVRAARPRIGPGDMPSVGLGTPVKTGRPVGEGPCPESRPLSDDGRQRREAADRRTRRGLTGRPDVGHARQSAQATSRRTWRSESAAGRRWRGFTCEPGRRRAPSRPRRRQSRWPGAAPGPASCVPSRGPGRQPPNCRHVTKR